MPVRDTAWIASPAEEVAFIHRMILVAEISKLASVAQATKARHRMFTPLKVIRSTLWLSVFWVSFGLSQVVAQVPLSVDMLARFAPSVNYAERLYLTGAASQDTVRADISFSNDEKHSVWIRWAAQVQGAYPDHEATEYEVSFQPTAVARRAGHSSTFYVVGWSARLARVVVEEWDVGTFALAQVPSPSGAAPKTELTLPPVTRSLLWVSNPGQLAPIWDAACDPYAGALWMLESGAVTRIHSLNLASLMLFTSFASDATGMSGLSGHRSFGVGLHPTEGFVIMSQAKMPWRSLRYESPSAVVFVANDADMDGVLDTTAFITLSEFHDAFPTPWDEHYPEP